MWFFQMQRRSRKETPPAVADLKDVSYSLSFCMEACLGCRAREPVTQRWLRNKARYMFPATMKNWGWKCHCDVFMRKHSFAYSRARISSKYQNARVSLGWRSSSWTFEVSTLKAFFVMLLTERIPTHASKRVTQIKTFWQCWVDLARILYFYFFLRRNSKKPLDVVFPQENEESTNVYQMYDLILLRKFTREVA